MTHEIRPNVGAIEYERGSLGTELETHLQGIHDDVVADVAIHHPDLIHGDRAWADGIVRLHSKIDALTTSKPERATEFMRLIDAIDERDGGGFIEQYNDTLHLLTGRMNYPEPVAPGFYCQSLRPGAAVFETYLDNPYISKFEVALKPTGDAVTAACNTRDLSWVRQSVLLKNVDERQVGFAAYRSMLNRVTAGLEASQANDNLGVTFEDVLGDQKRDFIELAIDKIAAARQWFNDCRASGIDPFDDAEWSNWAAGNTGALPRPVEMFDRTE